MLLSLLNQKIIIQKNKVLLDDNCNHLNSWDDYYSCFATISNELGRETNEVGNTQDVLSIDFTIRYCKKASLISTLNYRVLYNKEVYNIISIDHFNYKNKAIKLVCKKESYG